MKTPAELPTKRGLGLADWWRRTSDAWLKRWLERMRKDPDVTLSEFREAEKAIDKHFKEMEKMYRENAR